jgi:hypothetical protein
MAGLWSGFCGHDASCATSAVGFNTDWLEEAGNLIIKCSIGPKLSPCVDPKALSSGKEVVSTPEFFDEWLHDYRNPSEVTPGSHLDISIDELADSQYDPQIVCMHNNNAPLPIYHTLR